MSLDPSPPAVSAGFRALGNADAASPGAAGDGASPDGPGSGPTRFDDVAWGRWWRDLIIERYRFDRFDAFVPLPAEGCSWRLRVALGRVVEQSMAAVSGPSITTQLVAEALAATGFGRVGDLAPDARRVALHRSGWCSDPWPGADELRLGVLGTVADALLREVPPVARDLDLRSGSDTVATPASATVLAATRSAVFAYARHVEAQARRSRDVAKSYQF